MVSLILEIVLILEGVMEVWIEAKKLWKYPICTLSTDLLICN